MSHTDFITPFSIEETLAWPHNKAPEPRINPEKFTELLLQRWPDTGRPNVIQSETGIYHYSYDFRTIAEEYPRQLNLSYSCFVTVERANKLILASLAHIYRQCVPEEYKAYLIDYCEIPLSASEEEILELVVTQDMKRYEGPGKLT